MLLCHLKMNLQVFLGLDSLSSVKFFTRLQAGSAVFHSKQYPVTSFHGQIVPLKSQIVPQADL